MKPRQEHWRGAYRANRYLAQKPEAHLCERYRYLTECITTLTDSGQMGLEGRSKLGLWLWAKVTHTLLEFELRGLGLPAGMLERAVLPKTTFPNRPKGAAAYNNRKRKEGGSYSSSARGSTSKPCCCRAASDLQVPPPIRILR